MYSWIAACLLLFRILCSSATAEDGRCMTDALTIPNNLRIRQKLPAIDHVLSWDHAQSTCSVEYELARARDGGSEDMVLSKEPEVTIRDLEPGTVYSYRVRTVINNKYRSPFSLPVRFKTPSAYQCLLAKCAPDVLIDSTDVTTTGSVTHPLFSVENVPGSTSQLLKLDTLQTCTGYAILFNLTRSGPDGSLTKQVTPNDVLMTGLKSSIEYTYSLTFYEPAGLYEFHELVRVATFEATKQLMDFTPIISSDNSAEVTWRSFPAGNNAQLVTLDETEEIIEVPLGNSLHGVNINRLCRIYVVDIRLRNGNVVQGNSGMKKLKLRPRSLPKPMPEVAKLLGKPVHEVMWNIGDRLSDCTLSYRIEQTSTAYGYLTKTQKHGPAYFDSIQQGHSYLYSIEAFTDDGITSDFTVPPIRFNDVRNERRGSIDIEQVNAHVTGNIALVTWRPLYLPGNGEEFQFHFLEKDNIRTTMVRHPRQSVSLPVEDARCPEEVLFCATDGADLSDCGLKKISWRFENPLEISVELLQDSLTHRVSLTTGRLPAACPVSYNVTQTRASGDDDFMELPKFFSHVVTTEKEILFTNLQPNARYSYDVQVILYDSIVDVNDTFWFLTYRTPPPPAEPSATLSKLGLSVTWKEGEVDEEDDILSYERAMLGVEVKEKDTQVRIIIFDGPEFMSFLVPIKSLSFSLPSDRVKCDPKVLIYTEGLGGFSQPMSPVVQWTKKLPAPDEINIESLRDQIGDKLSWQWNRDEFDVPDECHITYQVLRRDHLNLEDLFVVEENQVTFTQLSPDFTYHYSVQAMINSNPLTGTFSRTVSKSTDAGSRIPTPPKIKASENSWNINWASQAKGVLNSAFVHLLLKHGNNLNTTWKPLSEVSHQFPSLGAHRGARFFLAIKTMADTSSYVHVKITELSIASVESTQDSLHIRSMENALGHQISWSISGTSNERVCNSNHFRLVKRKLTGFEEPELFSVSTKEILLFDLQPGMFYSYKIQRYADPLDYDAFTEQLIVETPAVPNAIPPSAVKLQSGQLLFNWTEYNSTNLNMATVQVWTADSAGQLTYTELPVTPSTQFDMPDSTNLQFYVAVKNVAGRSPLVRIPLETYMPLLPPSNVKVIAHRQRLAHTVVWDVQPLSPGTCLQMLFNITQTVTNEDDVSIETYYVTRKTQLTLDDLKPSTSYEYKVQAIVGDKFAGPFSEPERIFTPTVPILFKLPTSVCQQTLLQINWDVKEVMDQNILEAIIVVFEGDSLQVYNINFEEGEFLIPVQSCQAVWKINFSVSNGLGTSEIVSLVPDE